MALFNSWCLSCSKCRNLLAMVQTRGYNDKDALDFLSKKNWWRIFHLYMEVIASMKLINLVKMSKLSFLKQANCRAREKLQLVHTNLYGSWRLFPLMAANNLSYLLMISQEYNGYILWRSDPKFSLFSTNWGISWRNKVVVL